MHVVEFFICFLSGEQVEIIVPRLPNRLTHVNHGSISREVLLYPSLQPNRRSPLSLLNEPAEHAGFFEVDEDMDMIGHNHKAHTHAVILAQLIRQEMNDNALGAIIVKKPSPFVAGKSDKVSVAPNIKDLALHSFYPGSRVWSQASSASHPDSNPGHPPGNKNTLQGPSTISVRPRTAWIHQGHQ